MGDLRDISTEIRGKEVVLRESLYAVLNHAVIDGAEGRQGVLDIGCGRGELMRALVKQGYVCCGVDMEPECVALAAEYGTTFEGTFASLHELDLSLFPSGKPDVVVSSHVLEHVDEPLTCLRQSLELQASRYVFAVPNVLRSIRLVRALTGNPRADHPTHVFGWTQPEFAALLNRAGFEVIEWYRDRVTMNPLSGGLGVKLSRLLAPLETRLLPRLFPMLSSSLIVACRPASR